MDARHGSFPEDSSNDQCRIRSDSTMARALRDIAFGSVAGMVSEVFEYPFDLAKVRLQSQVLDNTARYGGPLDCLMQTWRTEGVRGLYRGLPVPMVGSMAETAGLFVAYSQLQTLVRWSRPKPSSEDLSIAEHGLAAGGAGFLTSFILTPVELVKCKMQVQMLSAPFDIPTTTRKFASLPLLSASHSIPLPYIPKRELNIASVRKTLPGPFTIVTNILRNSGPSGLWLGHTGTMFRETGGTAVWFASKEFIVSLLLARRSPVLESPSSHSPLSLTHTTTSSQADLPLAPWESALSGALSGALCVLALYPADTVKSAIQTASELRPPTAFLPAKQIGRHIAASPTFWGTAKAMFRAQGWRGLYAGCGMTIARAIPSSGIVFVVYDGLSQRFG